MKIVKRESRLLAVKVLLQKGYEWLACDADGTIVAYEVKPFKMTEDEWWNYDSEEPKFLTLDNSHDINFVKWEDDKPVNIREWLKEEEREMKLYYVRNGQLESKDVDVDFFEKNTTLGGLLAPNKVDMASCGDLTVGPLIRFPYLTSNMMATDTKDYDETDWYETENVQIHGEICKELTETYRKKNADYGNSFENSLDKHGFIAGIIRMDDKMSRLISLNSKNERQVMDESLRDTLMDLANYAIMSVMWLDAKSANESDSGYMHPTDSNPVALLDSHSYLLAAGEAFRAGFSAGIIGSTDRDIYADNQKLDIDKALREGAHPQAIRDFLGGADYDGDTTNS